MRTVVRNSEVPHLWMHKAQSNARNSTNSLFFADSTIFSYGEHFPIARHVIGTRKRVGILFTTQSHSVTTSAHCSDVRRAIPRNAMVFRVPNVYAQSKAGHEANLLAYAKEIASSIEKYQRAHINARWHHGEALGRLAEMRAYAEFFGFHSKGMFPTVPALDEAKVAAKEAAAKASAEKRWATISETKRREREEREARWAEERRIAALELPVKIDLWRGGANNVRLPYDHATLLRLSADGKNVETSRGANVPVIEARRALRFVRGIVQRGTAWKRNGETFRLGHYQIDSVEADGTLTAGCHVIGYDEIQRLAPALDAERKAELTEYGFEFPA